MTKDKFTSEVVDTLGAIYERGFAAGKKETTTWIPVSERLPENESLLCDDEGLIFIGGYSKRYECFEDYNEYILKNIIAWMPLPQPYKAESEDAE